MTHECTKFEQRPLPSGKKSNFVSLSVCLNRGWRRAVNKGAKKYFFLHFRKIDHLSEIFIWEKGRAYNLRKRTLTKEAKALS